MNSLPDPSFKPGDVDQVIEHFGKPLEPERKKTLMAKLESQRGRHDKEADQSSGKSPKRGR